MPKSTVYIETTVISYLVARLSRDVVISAHQQTTQDWWHNHRASHHLWISPEVIREASAGDPVYAAKRLSHLADIPLLDITASILTLSDELMARKVLPPRARSDAIHLAFASFHKIDILLTWNMRHLANPVTMAKARTVLAQLGSKMPEIVTPEQLLKD